MLVPCSSRCQCVPCLQIWRIISPLSHGTAAPGHIKPYEDTILEGVIQGIGIYFSSGDNGDESLFVGYTTTDWPASSPFVTAVGGTSLAVDAANNYLFETGWGTTTSSWTGTAWSPTPPGAWLYGGGGGVSRIFAEP